MSERRRYKELRLAVPSKGALSESTLGYFKDAGLKLSRPNARRYTGRMSGVADVQVLYQRAAEIPEKVIEGSVDVGVTGLDIVREDFNHNEVLILMEDLGFGRADLVLAVPESWLDVHTIGVFADLSWEWKARGREVRIATKFPNLVSSFLADHGVNYFQLVSSHGATEVAPEMGLADCIADLTSTGTTLRDNHLKVLAGGRIFRSQACLIGARTALNRVDRFRERVRMILETIEAVDRARQFYALTVHLEYDQAKAFEDELDRMEGADIRVALEETGLHRRLYKAEVFVPRRQVYEVVSVARRFSSRPVVANKVDYLFEPTSPAWRSLLHQLKS